MSRYSASTIKKDGFDVVVLQDVGSNSVAEIIPEIGNNLYRFESGDREVLMPPVSLKELKEKPFAPFWYGTPMLFPPNRIQDGTFSFNGRTYQFPINEPPFHLHGSIGLKAWEVVELGASEKEGAYVTSCFRYAEQPEIMAYFPHPLTFTVTCRLFEGKLELNGTITNEGEEEAPLAFGLHPYFALPFDSGEAIELQMPATEEWPITNLALVKGTPTATEFSDAISTRGISLTDYAPLQCSMLTMAGGDSTCRILLKDRGYTLAYRFGPEFPFALLFRPDWASSFSIEPYTYVTDAFNLPYEHSLTGARGIKTGESFTFRTSTWVE